MRGVMAIQVGWFPVLSSRAGGFSIVSSSKIAPKWVRAGIVERGSHSGGTRAGKPSQGCSSRALLDPVGGEVLPVVLEAVARKHFRAFEEMLVGIDDLPVGIDDLFLHLVEPLEPKREVHAHLLGRGSAAARQTIKVDERSLERKARRPLSGPRRRARRARYPCQEPRSGPPRPPASRASNRGHRARENPAHSAGPPRLVRSVLP